MTRNEQESVFSNLFWVLFAMTCVVATVFVSQRMSIPPVKPKGEDVALVTDVKAVADSVQVDVLKKTIAALAAPSSRVTGYEGCKKASALIQQRLGRLGFARADELPRPTPTKKTMVVETFSVPVPIDEGAELTVAAGGREERFRLYPLWPNLVRTSQVPRAGISGAIINAGDSRPSDYDGKVVKGAIVVLNFNCGNNWLNGAMFGAKAVIFRQPPTTVRGEAEQKFLTLPVDVPRFWIRQPDEARLDALLRQPGAKATITCRMPWKLVEGENILAAIPGTNPSVRDEWIVLEAYYDSMSVVPSLAPGAEQACGAAALLTLAEFFAKHPMQRSTLLVFTSGHCEALSGVKAFLARHANRTHHQAPEPIDIKLGVCFDISSGSEKVGLFYKGYFFDQAERNVQPWLSKLGRRAVEFAEDVTKALDVDVDCRFIDAINSANGRTWRTYMPGRLALDVEPFILAGVPAVCFATAEDARTLVDTPLDRPERLDMDNVTKQVQFLKCMVPNFLNSSGEFVPSKLHDEWCALTGRSVQFDVTVNMLPDKPVPGTLVVARGHENSKTMMGVRGDPIAMADENGHFALDGLPSIRATGWWRGQLHVEAFGLDPDSGAVCYAPDLGEQGAKSYSIDVVMDNAQKEVAVVVFPCLSMTIYDLVDQRYFSLLSSLSIYDAGTNSQPFVFGYSIPKAPTWIPYVEPCAVIYAQPGTWLRIGASSGPIGKQLLLLNASLKNPLGKGFLIDKTPSILYTPYQAARDMWFLDESRITRFAENGIENKKVMLLHRLAKASLAEATTALKERRYGEFLGATKAAWSVESRAYPDIVSTVNDSVKGVLFYLALMIPFAYFAERLLIAAKTIERRIAGVFGIFAALFLIIQQVHPAFRITLTPMIVLLAFVIMTLSAVVIVIIIMKFEHRLGQMRLAKSGVHEDDVGRVSSTMAAFTLGISNMRKRRFRTLLTSITLILLTFSVLSFTSVVKHLRQNKILYGEGKSVYNGILLRTKNWRPMSEEAYKSFLNEFGTKYTVAPRAWYYSAMVGRQSFVDVSNEATNKSFSANAAVGATAAEAVLFPQIKEALVAGRWLKPREEDAAVIPAEMADILGIALDDVKAGKNPRIVVFGKPIRVVGVYDSEKFQEIVDIDGEPLTPVDYVLMEQRREQEGPPDTDQLEKYLHIASSNVLFLPYRFVMSVGGSLRSVAMSVTDAQSVQEILRILMPRTALTLFASANGKVYLYSTIGATAVGGTGTLLIPIAIAALIVLNTMLGSVYERTREIAIFNAIGLAPAHVAALFIAESLVYAVIGAVCGYLLGQTWGAVVHATGWNVGVTLNYSSLSAVGTSIFIMLVVLASTAYPARLASHMAMPAAQMKWSLPDTPGDSLAIQLPFTVTGDFALGLNMYLREYLMTHVECSIGEFSSENIRLEADEGENGHVLRLDFDAWLVPYDLGVSQHVCMETLPTDDPGIFRIHIRLNRLSGDASSWRRLNMNFLNVLRKQFLIWRTLREVGQMPYVESGRKELGISTFCPSTVIA